MGIRVTVEQAWRIGGRTSFAMDDAASLAYHQPVMPGEVLAYLNPRPGAMIVDGTLGTGGHSVLLAPQLLPEGRLIGVDRDHDSIEVARHRLAEFGSLVTCVDGNYRDLPGILSRLGIARVDGILLDLGMSSPQVDRAERGFSFLRSGPLDMRMDQDQHTTAETLVNELPADELAHLFATLGEERFAQRIARRMSEARKVKRITTTVELAELVRGAVPSGARYGRIHPATRVFQALRMAVNDELGALESLLGELPALLNPGGRAVIITFHSLEDRLVKRAFVQGKADTLWTILTKHVVCADEAETAVNPRARSAKLRAVERLAT